MRKIALFLALLMLLSLALVSCKGEDFYMLEQGNDDSQNDDNQENGGNTSGDNTSGNNDAGDFVDTPIGDNDLPPIWDY